MENLNVSEIEDLFKRAEATVSSLTRIPSVSRFLRILKRESLVKIQELNNRLEGVNLLLLYDT